MSRLFCGPQRGSHVHKQMTILYVRRDDFAVHKQLAILYVRRDDFLAELGRAAALRLFMRPPSEHSESQCPWGRPLPSPSLGLWTQKKEASRPSPWGRPPPSPARGSERKKGRHLPVSRLVYRGKGTYNDDANRSTSPRSKKFVSFPVTVVWFLGVDVFS